MSILLRLATSVLTAAIAACSFGNDDAAHEEPPPVEETVFGDMVGTMDKARGVEDTTMQHKQDIDRTLQESEGAGDSSDH